MKKCVFLAATKVNLLLPPKMENSFVKVLIDFLTIIKYRKKGINKISSEHVEMLYKRLELFILILSDNNKNKEDDGKPIAPMMW
jgi:hypothetical protein